MQFFLEHLAVSIAACTGVLAARGKEVDLFGVIVLALATAFGGGTIRDVLLRLDVFWINNTGFLLNVVVTAVVTFYLVRYRELPATVLMVGDAFALALFAMVGAEKAMGQPVSSAMVVMMGVITGVAGGMLRDLLIGEIPLVFRREIYLYATAAFCGCLCFVLIHRWSANAHLNMILGVAVILILRLVGIRWRIALPIFRPKHAKPPQS
jgi:uncharacterized membrane protein YeiH